MLPEQHWLPTYWEAHIGITADGLVTRDLLDMLLADRRFMRLELPLKPVADLVETEPPLHYERFVSELFDLYAMLRGKHLAGEKTPMYARYIPALMSLWPQARVVHLIRDGRDVALSLLEWDRAERNIGRFPTWEQEPLTTAALYWEWNVRMGREDGARLGAGRYYEMRYEDLVKDPPHECARLAMFLDLPYDSSMISFHHGRTQDTPGLSAKKSWQPITAGLRSWRQQMAPADIARFEAASGPLLDELGYARGAPAPTGAAVAEATQARDLFMEHAAVRPGLPKAWVAVSP